MFHDVDLSQDIDDIIKTIEDNCSDACKVRKRIQELSLDRQVCGSSSSEQEISSPVFQKKDEDDSRYDDYLEDIISLYHSVYTQEDIEDILPSSDDYNYRDIILRLHAESLKEIKEMTEMSIEDGNYEDEDVQLFIQSEYKKIDILQSLLCCDNLSLEEVGHSNKLFLIPNPNGRIRVLDDLSRIPSEHYDEINALIVSIINGTFKGVKKFSSNRALVGGVCEVKGSLARVLFKRLNTDTYAIISVFLKKVNNDRGYQEFIKHRIGEFRLYEDTYKKKLEDEEYMKLNDFYVEELFNTIGTDSKDRVYKKVMQDD